MYLEAKKSKDGKSIEIRTKPMTLEETVKEMGNGKHIITKNKELAQNAVKNFGEKYNIKIPEKDLKPENPHKGIEGYYYHIHYWRLPKQHLHCWMWDSP